MNHEWRWDRNLGKALWRIHDQMMVMGFTCREGWQQLRLW